MTVKKRLRNDILTFIDRSIPPAQYDCAMRSHGRRFALAAAMSLATIAVVFTSAWGIRAAFFSDEGACGHCGQRMNYGEPGEPVEYRGGEMTLTKGLLLPDYAFALFFETSIPCSEEDARCATGDMYITWYWEDMGLSKNGSATIPLMIEAEMTGSKSFVIKSVLNDGVWNWISAAIDANWDKKIYTFGPGGGISVRFPLKSDALYDYETDPSTTMPSFGMTFDYFKKG